MSASTVKCSFDVDRDLYNAYKSVVTRNGQHVRGNLIKYMNDVIKFNIPNAETIEAIQESERLIKDKNARTYSNFSEILEEIENE